MPDYEIIRFTSCSAAPAVAAVGFFDGVHLGHQFLFCQVRALADETGAAALAVTFAEHPRRVLSSDYRPQLLTTLPEKLELLRSLGLDACAVLHFSETMAALTSRQFMERYLRDAFGVTKLVVGYDHHFGSDVAATHADYEAEGRSLGISVVASTAFQTAEFTVSSSTVRRLLEGGNVERARQCLGRPYTLGGTVVEGRHLGRDLGYPTANLQPAHPDKLVPGRGVYAVEATVGGRSYGAMLNIGWRPTLSDGRGPTIEAHLFGFDGDLYGRTLSLAFLHRLRDEQRFDSLPALQAQLRTDAVRCRELLNL